MCVYDTFFNRKSVRIATYCNKNNGDTTTFCRQKEVKIATYCRLTSRVMFTVGVCYFRFGLYIFQLIAVSQFFNRRYSIGIKKGGSINEQRKLKPAGVSGVLASLSEVFSRGLLRQTD